MNLGTSYSALTRNDDDNENLPLPPPPRQRNGETPASARKWALRVIFGWSISMLLLAQMRRASFNSIVIVTVAISVSYVAFFVLLIVLLLKGREDKLVERRHKLYVEGIAATATVTYIGVVRSREGNEFCIAVEWSFIADGIEITGRSPRAQLPNVVIGDTFCVLYEKEHPWYAFRRALFDSDGNMRDTDSLPWKLETNINFGYRVTKNSAM